MQTLENIPYDELQLGQRISVERTVLEEDILLFAKLSGDVNPIHLDDAYAGTTQFGERIAHGMLTAAFISAAFAKHLPGPGSIYRNQSLRFRAPVKIGDTLTITIEVIDKRDRNHMVTMSTIVTNQRGETIVTGEGSAIVPNEKIVIEAPDLPAIHIG